MVRVPEVSGKFASRSNLYQVFYYYTIYYLLLYYAMCLWNFQTAPPPTVLWSILFIHMRKWWFRTGASIYMVSKCPCVFFGRWGCWYYGVIYGVFYLRVFYYITGRFPGKPVMRVSIYDHLDTFDKGFRANLFGIFRCGAIVHFPSGSCVNL